LWVNAAGNTLAERWLKATPELSTIREGQGDVRLEAGIKVKIKAEKGDGGLLGGRVWGLEG
jgi:hypothetical protein